MSSPAFPFEVGLGGLPLIRNSQTRSICAENPTGAKGGGAQAVPQPNEAGSDLGKGWKSRACLLLDPNTTTTLAEIEGPGVIQHIWITTDNKVLRDLILRIYWDGENRSLRRSPARRLLRQRPRPPRQRQLACRSRSIPPAASTATGRCPSASRRRSPSKASTARSTCGFFYQITYALQDVPADAGYFHAQWRRAMTTREHPEHTILDHIKRHRSLLSAPISPGPNSPTAGGAKARSSSSSTATVSTPTICGTGTEDYFGGAWGFYGDSGREERFSTPFLGMPLVRLLEREVPKFGLYRWHIMDPIRFAKDLRVTIQALGWYPNGKFQPLTDDISSTAFWYQQEPHGPFPTLPGVVDRWPR